MKLSEVSFFFEEHAQKLALNLVLVLVLFLVLKSKALYFQSSYDKGLLTS